MNKICCYTCIIGPYDRLREVKHTNKNIDYICFTDQNFSSQTWNIRKIPSDLNGLNDIKKQRVIKICPHRYLSEYDISIWIDGNIEVIGDMVKFIKQYDLSKNCFYSRVHPSRKCIYEEADACVKLHKDTLKNVRCQIDRYSKEGYPKNIGMVETNVIVRKHNDIQCVLLDNMWATELLLGSHRDQLSFNYVCWKRHFVPGYLVNEFNLRKNKFMRINNHG